MTGTTEEYTPFLIPNFDEPQPLFDLADGETCPSCDGKARDNRCKCPMFDNNGIEIEVEDIEVKLDDTH